MHKLYGSRFLIDSQHNLGFSEVQRFERSVAFHHRIHIEGIDNESFLQHVADNVDHNLRAIDGLNTFHGMGIIAIVTPRVTTKRPLPKVTLSSSQVIEVGGIETYIL